MGGDGGSVPRRQDQVARRRPRGEDASNAELASLRRASAWSHCALTALPLRAPVCCDDRGRLYNLEAVLAALVAKSPALGPIRSRRQVFQIRPTEDPASTPEAPRFRCPVTGLAAAGDVAFTAVDPCGHVVAEKAWKVAGGRMPGACPVCEQRAKRVVRVAEVVATRRGVKRGIEAAHSVG